MQPGAIRRAPQSLPVFTHHETASAAPVIAVSTPAARSKPSTAAISNQWLHMRTTLASIKSVQKIKTQAGNLSRIVSVAAFRAERAFRRAIALNLCNFRAAGLITGSTSRVKLPPECKQIWCLFKTCHDAHGCEMIVLAKARQGRQAVLFFLCAANGVPLAPRKGQ
jgi:hypothetical protein